MLQTAAFAVLLLAAVPSFASPMPKKNPPPPPVVPAWTTTSTDLIGYTSPPSNKTYGTAWDAKYCIERKYNYGYLVYPLKLSPQNGTVAACLDACAALDRDLCGIDVYGCWTTSLDRPNPYVNGNLAAYCQSSCPGDPTHLCGQADPDFRQTSYVRDIFPVVVPDPATISSTTTTTTTTTTSSSTTTTTSDVPTTTTTTTTTDAPTIIAPTSAPSPTPTRLLTDSYWTYKACYRDDAVGERTIKNLVAAGTGQWTIEGCLAAVRAADYSVGGIIYGGEWGSDTIPNKLLVQDPSLCNWKCNDNQGELCGGQNSVDVYFTRSTTKLIDDDLWSYQGCYSDDNGRRTLANLVTAEGPQAWTIEKCLAAVNLAGYKYGAVEYGGECWGADSLRGDAAKLSTSSCNMRCNDAADNTCGGTNALDVYRLR